MTKKTKIISSVLVAILIISAITFLLISNNTTQTLNGNEIRSNYPLIKESNTSVDTMTFTFSEAINFSKNIIEFEVIEKLPDYTVTNKEINVTLTFNKYKIKVLENIKGEITDDYITIVMNTAFENTNPVLEVGTVAISPIEESAGEHAGNYRLGGYSIYYVDSDLALAAYDNDDSIAKEYCKKGDLVNEMKKVINA